MKKRNPPTFARIILYVVLIVLVAVCVGPMVWALSASFKDPGDIFQYPPKLLPSPATTANYASLLSTQPFIGWLLTSLIVAILSSAISAFVCSLAGYAFAMFAFRGKEALFSLMFSSLAVPFVVVAVPLFVMLSRAGLTNAYFVLIVPWVAPAFGIFMMRQFAEQSVPPDLIEAARIDGCGELRTFWTIVFPLLRPGAGALAVWAFVNSYNSFLWPLIAVSSPSNFTLPLGLQALYGAQNHQYNLVMAGAILATIPALIIFIALRRQLLEGLSAGSVKG
ncbi:carbohydrate ABC transporter permease [Sinomonas terrae]|uniref:Carbohydrate ABC transporter permease n=1 Tax=Sinomonas terrae TaxID=2908838 RepID=A0ABS9U6E3_9MICC|nr:carbohydrate ABC transporter permease [Sinomonas terrae]MCH6472106.1 carbohydrate ABC transporter permease [Sinomonas terrae]